jgi:hypothetical protein
MKELPANEIIQREENDFKQEIREIFKKIDRIERALTLNDAGRTK